MKNKIGPKCIYEFLTKGLIIEKSIVSLTNPPIYTKATTIKVIIVCAINFFLLESPFLL